MLAWLLLALAAFGCDDGMDGPEAGATAQTPTAPVDPTADATTAPPAAEPAGPPLEPTELPDADVMAKTLDEQRANMVKRMQAMGVIDADQGARILEIMAVSKLIGQGNPEVVDHPMSRRECIDKRKAAGVQDPIEPQCGALFMTPLYRQGESKETAKVCIDRFEYPGLPCDYPLTWVTAAQAQRLCNVTGKRLCDAHEWEGACAGSLEAPEDEYMFGSPRTVMRGVHNRDRDIVWAYGPKKDHAKCATDSRRSPKCETSGWKQCGSNTYPAGSFPECRSAFGVYDQHGNAAEHMLLPMSLGELGGKSRLPEMKGSWFIFNKFEAHIDDCRWRAPSWHENEGMHHGNYHLGFRCCKDL